MRRWLPRLNPFVFAGVLAGTFVLERFGFNGVHRFIILIVAGVIASTVVAFLQVRDHI